jgi:TolB-like protein
MPRCGRKAGAAPTPKLDAKSAMTDTPAARPLAVRYVGERRLKLSSFASLPLSLVLSALIGLPAALAQEEVSDDTVRIALLPMRVHSSESREYLQAGLVDMLVSRLEQINAIHVIRIDNPSKATTSYDVATKAGREVGADYVLFGSFTQFGQGASLDVQLAATGSDESPMRQIFVQSGTMADVIPDLDSLVGKISRYSVSDFDYRASADPPLPGAPKRETLADLRERVAELEAAVRLLDPSFGADPTAGEDVEGSEGEESPEAAAATSESSGEAR